MIPRTIIHADLDAFYTSVEQVDRPDLRDKPVVVGGSPERRGVVAAASYEARRFGICSAMPMARALNLCQELVRVTPRFDRYREISQQVMTIFRSVTPLVEPTSIDEAFLDVTDQVANRDSGTLAIMLKSRVREETGLNISIGLGSTKTVAKIASDLGKPDGLIIVPVGGETRFLGPLPVQMLWGVGPQKASVLKQAGIITIADLAQTDAPKLNRLLGSRAKTFLATAHGVDERLVVTTSEAKSVGREKTFSSDITDGPELKREIFQLSTEVSRRLNLKRMKATTITLKLRFADFRTITRQQSLLAPIADASSITRVALALLAKTITPADRFRLLGIQGAGLTERDSAQMALWLEHDADNS